MTGVWSSSLRKLSLREIERCLKKVAPNGVGRPPGLSALLHRHGVDASDCAENIYIQDGGYDYDLAAETGVVLTTNSAGFLTDRYGKPAARRCNREL